MSQPDKVSRQRRTQSDACLFGHRGFARGAGASLVGLVAIACGGIHVAPNVSSTLEQAAGAAERADLPTLARCLADDDGRELSPSATQELLDDMGPELRERLRQAQHFTQSGSTLYTFARPREADVSVVVRPRGAYLGAHSPWSKCFSSVADALRAIHADVVLLLRASQKGQSLLQGRFAAHVVADWQREATALADSLAYPDELDISIAGNHATVVLSSERILEFVREWDCWKLELVK